MSTPTTTDRAPQVECPMCEGTPYRLARGARWGYAGGSPAEYEECPACEGAGTVDEDQADDVRRRAGYCA